jgi:hypothetical protein
VAAAMAVAVLLLLLASEERVEERDGVAVALSAVNASDTLRPNRRGTSLANIGAHYTVHSGIKFNGSTAPTVLWIRTHFFRIWIRKFFFSDSVSDLYTNILNRNCINCCFSLLLHVFWNLYDRETSFPTEKLDSTFFFF